MKKTQLFLLILILLVLPLVSADIMPQTTAFINSVDQYYSVVYDGEGDAIVSLSLLLKNTDVTPISTINLEIPGNQVLLYGAMQETTNYNANTCTAWAESCVEYGSGSTCVQYDYNGNCIKYETPCLRKDKVCSSYTQSHSYQPIYQKINVQPQLMSNSVSLPITLISPVQQNGQTKLLIVYKMPKIAKNSFGAFNFNFESAKIQYNTNNLRVAINVQSGLYLKGTSSNVNYLPDIGFTNTLGAAKETASMSSDIDRFERQIQYTQGMVKSASYLDPFESLSVAGTYSKSWSRLYWIRIFFISLLILLIIAFLVYGVIRLHRYAREKAPEKVVKQNVENKHLFLIPFLAGLFTSIGITIVWAITLLVVAMAENISRHGAGEIFALLLALFAVLITLALIIGVPIYAGSRYGAITSAFTVISILGWMFIFALLSILIMKLFSSPIFY